MKYLIALLFAISIAFSQFSLAASFQQYELQYDLKEADQGNPWAQYKLGIRYSNGDGVPQDDAEAFKWFKLAADQGYPYAQAMLGIMYMNGDGVRQDYAEAKEWFGKSCDNGYQMGCDQYRELNNL